MENLRLSVTYFFLTLVIVFIVLSNYFHSYIENLIPNTPLIMIPGVSVFFCIAIGYIFYVREKKVERMKYDFLTIATHRFRTPITAIRWFLDSLKGEMLYEERMDVVKQIRTLVDRLMETVDMLTGFAKFDRGLSYAFEVTWPRDMIDISLSKYAPKAKEKDIVFNVVTDHEIPLVIVDKRKIQSVIDVLFENAINYSKKGGQIDVNLYKDGRFVGLKVTDHGIGIKNRDLHNLFKRFYRSNEAKLASPEGMGLSLYMIKEIVREHGGKITVESPGLDKGTTFTVSLRASNKRPS